MNREMVPSAKRGNFTGLENDSTAQNSVLTVIIQLLPYILFIITQGWEVRMIIRAPDYTVSAIKMVAGRRYSAFTGRGIASGAPDVTYYLLGIQNSDISLMSAKKHLTFNRQMFSVVTEVYFHANAHDTGRGKSVSPSVELALV